MGDASNSSGSGNREKEKSLFFLHVLQFVRSTSLLLRRRMWHLLEWHAAKSVSGCEVCDIHIQWMPAKKWCAMNNVVQYRLRQSTQRWQQPMHHFVHLRLFIFYCALFVRFVVCYSHLFFSTLLNARFCLDIFRASSKEWESVVWKLTKVNAFS